MKTNNYWTTSDTQMIKTFYYCYTASTSAATRNQIFTKLQPKFNYLINNAIQSIMSSWSKEDKEEAHQDAMMKLWLVLSNKLDPDRLKAVLNFLWITTQNILYTVARQKSCCKPQIVYNSDHPTISVHYEDYEEPQPDDQDIRQQILLEIDKKIICQEKLNRTNTVYLVLLKEFLIANDFNSKGFQQYVCDILQINRENFYQINYKLGIRSQVFNNKNW